MIRMVTEIETVPELMFRRTQCELCTRTFRGNRQTEGSPAASGSQAAWHTRTHRLHINPQEPIRSVAQIYGLGPDVQDEAQRMPRWTNSL